MTSRVSAALLLALALASGPTGAQTEGDAGLVETTRVRLLTVRFRLEPKFEAEPGECSEVTRSNLSIRLRDRTIQAQEIVSIARDERPMLHAFLIDRSLSMTDKLDMARRALHKYIARLRPGLDRGMVVVFDEDVVLASPATSDPNELYRAVDGIALGSSTAMYDALHVTIGELSNKLERPIVLLLSDGVDSASIANQDDVLALAALRPDLTVFPIGVHLPDIAARGAGAPPTPKKFLESLARQTDGEFLNVPTAGGLGSAYNRVRELLDSEWEVVIADPEPDAASESPRIKITRKRCSIQVLARGKDDKPSPDEQDTEKRESTPDCTADLRAYPRNAARLAPRLGSSWAAATSAASVRGCAVDMTSDDGLLYDSQEVDGAWTNGWREIGSRPFEIVVSAPEELPTLPEHALDAIARALAKHKGPVPSPGPRQEPIERHARPFRDLPLVWNGRTALAARTSLAHALAERPEYAAYAQKRSEEEIRRLLDDEATRIVKTSPGTTRERMREALAVSPEGQALLARAEKPGPRELTRHLGAWIGDVPAVDVFRAWELQAIARELAGEPDIEPAFEEAYQAAYRLFFVPSYARILSPLVMGKDPKTGAVGLWRFVLPQVVWIGARKKDLDDPEYRRVPMDLVPDRPLGLLLARQIADETRGKGLTPTELTYEPLVDSNQLEPGKAFDHVRVTLSLGEFTYSRDWEKRTLSFSAPKEVGAAE